MNQVILIGRLTRDPEVRYTADQMAVASFSIAIDRPVAAGKEKQTDFPRVTVFGKQAENCERYLAKGRMTAVQGRIRTGSYKNKEGATVYTTEVVADRVEFIDWGDKGERGGKPETAFFDQDYNRPPDVAGKPGVSQDSQIPEGFTALDDDDDDLPF
ncbi:MAG: single-stranded DNA-binding protein [Clostridiales Family XIII bacterium]|jgi:single-strand DNA-binding protein|nr:single-stranded DNA-binding protein [Clostridiales Family XIII bacterium]